MQGFTAKGLGCRITGLRLSRRGLSGLEVQGWTLNPKHFHSCRRLGELLSEVSVIHPKP